MNTESVFLSSFCSTSVTLLLSDKKYGVRLLRLLAFPHTPTRAANPFSLCPTSDTLINFVCVFPASNADKQTEVEGEGVA